MRSLLLPALIGLSTASGQVLTPSLLTPLNTTLNETSGLLVLGGEVWTQLDSGNPNTLLQVDPGTGEVLRTVTVTNASNSDWEDIAADGEWVYIGDFGNNAGSRTDLRVYRVALAELLDPGVFEIQADTIRFAYADQVDFTPANQANNWDCEAMIAMDDSLFLFTKNWLNSETYLYALPAIPGDHLAMRRDTLDTQGLITGATLDTSAHAIALCGYTNLLSPFVWLLEGYTGHDLFSGSAERHGLQLFLTQTEGIAWSSPGVAYLTNEQNTFSAARLWELGLDISTATAPDPATQQFAVIDDIGLGIIVMSVPQACTIHLFDESGRAVMSQVLKVGRNEVYTGTLRPGMYLFSTDDALDRGRIVVAR